MCIGFSAIITKDGRILFCEPNSDGNVSHSEILKRAGIEDDAKLLDRTFVRIEFPNWSESSFKFDEPKTLPPWVDEEELKNKSVKLLNRILPIYNEYNTVENPAKESRDKIISDSDSLYKSILNKAFEEYKTKTKTVEFNESEKIAEIEKNKVISSAWSDHNCFVHSIWVDYKTFIDKINKAHNELVKTMIAEYNRLKELDRKDYENKINIAKEDHDKVCNDANQSYEETNNEAKTKMIDKISKIEGHV
ncbi:MAG: hypothetical protein WC554_09290 [Clostridia bacterium]